MSKTWLITGAARGLGAEIARAILAAGGNVVATARNVQVPAGHTRRKTNACFSMSPT